ncbi:uncharacterized protein LOC106152343 [Lingula anatina]|uniref:Uncharacterized protein LOC106152343 n=1 Tax=Lingula anatina TaxID=7574 RepID=A0A1S3H895_LINAN|nr:uncharacterized protein LOC106152343 [Lingula anatina]|eukprot:XP_013381344.1 uncharacterized protein LOC106152343 [Lingula anatina]
MPATNGTTLTNATTTTTAAVTVTAAVELLTMTASVTSYTSAVGSSRVTVHTNLSTMTGFSSDNTSLAPEPEPEPGSAYAEPEPEWEEARELWGAAWPIHLYGIGSLFLLLAVFLLVSIVRLYRKRNLLSRGYFLSLTGLMLLMASTRTIYLLVDGYNANNTFPRFVSYFLYTLTFPCITSAFSILFLALLRTTRMQLLSPKIQKAKYLAVIIGSHFGFSILTDIIVGYFVSAKLMLFLCQLAFILWGFLIFIGYLYIFRRLYTAALKRQRGMEKLASRHIVHTYGRVRPFHKSYQFTLSLAVKLVLVAAILGCLSAMLKVYALVGVYGVFSTQTPEPWPWWAFKFSFRILELCLCATMSYVATQPFRYHHRPNNDHSADNCGQSCGILYFSPCRNLVECSSVDQQEVSNLHWDDGNDDDLSSSLGSMAEEHMVTGGGGGGEEDINIIHDAGPLVPEEMLPLNRYAGVDVHQQVGDSPSPLTPSTSYLNSPAREKPTGPVFKSTIDDSELTAEPVIIRQLDSEPQSGIVAKAKEGGSSHACPSSTHTHHPSAISCLQGEDSSMPKEPPATESLLEPKDASTVDNGSMQKIWDSDQNGDLKPGSERSNNGKTGAVLPAETDLDTQATNTTGSNTEARARQSPPALSQQTQSQLPQSQLSQSKLSQNKAVKQSPTSETSKFKTSSLMKRKNNSSPSKSKRNNDNKQSSPEYPHDKSIDAQSRVLLGSQSQYGYSVLNNSPSPTQEVTQQNKTNTKMNIKNSQAVTAPVKPADKPKHRFSFPKLLFRSTCDSEFRKASKSSESSSKSDSDLNSGIIITPESSSSTDQNTLEEEVNGVRIAMDRLNSQLHCDV